MILTYKVKHNRNFSSELNIAKKIADFAIRTKSNTSRDVKHFGLKSAIANQVLRKYRKRYIKKASNVKLTVPGQGVRFDPNSRTAQILCLKLSLDCRYLPVFAKIRQIEIGKTFAYLGVDMQEKQAMPANRFIGVDCNTTGHAAVAAIPHTGKIYKLGKSTVHIHTKYKSIKARLQKQSKYSLLRQIKSRESNIIRNINHHISKKLVQIAASQNCGIRFEKLTGIRKNKKHTKSFRYSLNSWSYYQLQKFTEYKARSQGIEVAYVAPAYTSKSCSRCGSLGCRDGKKFECVRCGHADHADVNASFNIGNPVSHCAFVPKVHNMNRLHKESDLCKGSTDTPQTAMSKMMATVEP
ncbi:MAG: RNA-guided endonuclease InsQ/TnpB family protein [Nitrosotalea sp.]